MLQRKRLKCNLENSLKCTACVLSENEAREWALSAGLLEPITVKEIQSRMVSEWQAEYAIRNDTRMVCEYQVKKVKYPIKT